MMNSRETKQPQIPVTHCAWCGSYDLGIGWQQNEAIVTFRRPLSFVCYYVRNVQDEYLVIPERKDGMVILASIS